MPPGVSTVVPPREKETVPPSPSATGASAGAKRSVCRGRPAADQCCSRASSRAAGPQAHAVALAPVRHEDVELGGLQQAARVGVPLEQGEARLRGGQGAQLVPEEHLVRGGGAVQQDDVGEGAGLGELAEHAHDGGEAAAGRDHQQAGGQRVGQHEVAVGLGEPEHLPGLDARGQVGADEAAGDGLDGDRHGPVGLRRAGEGVGAPLQDTVDADADPQPLAGPVTGPARPGAQHQRHRPAGLRPHLLDPRPQVDRAAEGVDEGEVVVGEQGCADGAGHAEQPVAQGGRLRAGRRGSGRRHDIE